MKAALIIIGMAALPPWMVSAESIASPDVGKQIQSELQSAFRFNPSPDRAEISVTEGSILAPYEVSAPSEGQKAADRIERYSGMLESSRFTPANGGSLLRASLGGARCEAGAWAAPGGINFLKFSW